MVRFFSLLSTWLSWYSRVAWSKANKQNVSQKPSTPIHLVESHYIFGSVLVIRCEHESHFACEEQRKRERKTREKRLRQGVLCFGNSIEPKIRGFKWKDNGSWAALCHYLTHSIRFGSSTFPCFQLIHTHTLSLSLILEQYIHHIIFGNVTHESLACGTCHLRNAFHDDYERRRRHRHQMSVLYMVGTRMWWHSYRFLRSAFHTKMKNYTKYLSRFALWMSYLYLAICACVYGNQQNETHFNFSTLDSVVYRCTIFLRASSKYRCCFSHFLHLFRVFVSSPIVSLMHCSCPYIYIPFGES